MTKPNTKNVLANALKDLENEVARATYEREELEKKHNYLKYKSMSLSNKVYRARTRLYSSTQAEQAIIKLRDRMAAAIEEAGE